MTPPTSTQPRRPTSFARSSSTICRPTNIGGRVHTRFPPEPNGYLHIGHAKSICLNFGLAAEFGGKTNLRFDDTNPEKEEQEYVDSIIDNVRWLGFDWEDRIFYASDYFGQLYEWALQLIRDGKAFVCDLSAEEMRQYRGTLTEPGTRKPISQPLRGRKPRSLRAHESRRVSRWLAHPAREDRHGLAQSESARPGDVSHPPRRRIIAPATHGPSIRCTTSRTASPIPSKASRTPSARWNSKITARSTTGIIDQLGIYHPQQIEFDRLNLTYTLLSKRKLLQLVQEDHVRGWDDPRMPTLSGIRRRGYTPEAIRNFCNSHRRIEDQRHHRTRPARTLCPRGSEQTRARA